MNSARSRESVQAAELMRIRQGMNRYASVALTTASFFLIIMAVLVNSPPLFYMATAIVATLGGARLQAWLAVRGLRFERQITPAVMAGETVTVHITVWSERRLKRPLVTVVDHLPNRLVRAQESPSLPVAPSFDQPIQTRYSFQPLRRGRHKWSQITVYGTDALGLVTLSKTYTIEPAELTVYPHPLPASLSITPTGGWGQSELDTGRSLGAGLEIRGVRDYVQGDAIKTIHWRSTAKTGSLMVKEFESGTGVNIKMLLQRTKGSEVGLGELSTLEAMCGHALYLGTAYLKRGATVLLPQLEESEAAFGHPEKRERDLREALTDIQADRLESMSADLMQQARVFRPGDTLLIFLSVRDDALPSQFMSLIDVQKVCLIYSPSDYAEGPVELRGVEPANAPDFIAALESAGAQVIVMPRVEAVR